MKRNARMDSDRGKQSATQYSVCIETDTAFAPVVEAGLDLLGVVPVSWEDVEQGTVRFEEFFDTEAAAFKRRVEMELALREWARGEPWSVSIRTFEAQDWQETWKRFSEFPAACMGLAHELKPGAPANFCLLEIGRASCRERVWYYV